MRTACQFDIGRMDIPCSMSNVTGSAPSRQKVTTLFSYDEDLEACQRAA